MKKLLLFLIMSMVAINAMQAPLLPQTPTGRLAIAILKPDFEEVKHLLYSNDFTQAEIQAALETAQGAHFIMVIPGVQGRIREMNQIINLLKAFRVFSARSAQ